jgi:hypothetical protein
VLLLSKILSLLVYPLSLCLLLLVLAMVMRMRGAPGRANGLTLLATVWLYFCATEWGATALLTPLEAAYPAFADEELPTAEAIVVLGGAITSESRFGQVGDLNQAADRLWRAATLYQSEKAPLLVLSGGSTLAGGLPESQMMAQKLRAFGIPDTALMQEAESRTTRATANQPHSVGDQCQPYATCFCGICRAGVHRDPSLHRPSDTAPGWTSSRLVTHCGAPVPIDPSHPRMGRLSGLLMAWISRALRG